MLVQSLLLFTCLLRLWPGAESQSPGSLRLVSEGGTPSNLNRGLLQAYYNGRWGRVCDSTGTFRKEEANVACRQLGFASATEYTTISSSASFLDRLAVTAVSGPLDNWLDQLNCRDGSESSLDECRTQNIGIASTDCSIQDYVAVSCVGGGALAVGAIVGIVFAVLITLCLITVVVVVVFCVCCAGATICCAGRHNSRGPETINVNVTTNADTPAPPPSYPQGTVQPTAAYIPYSGVSGGVAPLQAAPQQLYKSPAGGPPAVEMDDVQVAVVT